MKEKRWGAVDLLFWGGCALISAGVGLLWGVPAGLISAGVACLTGSYLNDTGKHGEGEGGGEP